MRYTVLAAALVIAGCGGGTAQEWSNAQFVECGDTPSTAVGSCAVSPGVFTASIATDSYKAILRLPAIAGRDRFSVFPGDSDAQFKYTIAGVTCSRWDGVGVTYQATTGAKAGINATCSDNGRHVILSIQSPDWTP